jgi:hypothetical protein
MTVINISVVLIPSRESAPIETHHISWNLEEVDAFRRNVCSLLQDTDFLETPLSRPRDSVAGLYAYYNTNSKENNVRATRLAMTCGLLAKRFYGDVLLVRSFGGRWEDLRVQEIFGASAISPDLRQSIQNELAKNDTDNNDKGDASMLPPWLLDAAQHNYHDGAALAQVASAMNVAPPTGKEEEDEEGSDTASISISSSDGSNEDTEGIEKKNGGTTTHEFVTKSPLCLHCRGPTNQLCSGCEGAYFCPHPRSCCDIGWSHSCQCSTWNLYSLHRKDLSAFDFLGDWHHQLFGREFQMQEAPYEGFLQSLGIARESCTSWWRTEMGGGWSGGQGDSASIVDASIRRSYSEGFAPITHIPPELRITNDDMQNSKKNDVGLVSLSSWEDYYRLRGISASSPVALLCTFPLTVYYAIERYGEVPVTVAKMLKRKLRVHIVGAEKEIHFLDLFKEVGFLLPEDVEVRNQSFDKGIA